jgi:hypothetical protein
MCGNKDAYEKILNARSGDFNNFASSLTAILTIIGGDCKGYDTEAP